MSNGVHSGALSKEKEGKEIAHIDNWGKNIPVETPTKAKTLPMWAAC